VDDSEVPIDGAKDGKKLDQVRGLVHFFTAQIGKGQREILCCRHFDLRYDIVHHTTW